MGKDRVRVKGASKGKRWVKGKSSSSNPESKKHRNAAKGKFGSHLISGSKGLPLTSQALALHDRGQSSSELAEHSEFEGESLGTTSTAITTSSVYSLVETAHPVFGSVRKLWKNPSLKHQNVLATLAAISEVIKSKDGEEIETEYFCLLLSALESAEDEETAFSLVYLLELITPKVQSAVFKSKFSSIAKIFTDKLVEYSESANLDLLTSLLKSLFVILLAQASLVWGQLSVQSLLRILLTFTMHSEPKVRKTARRGVVSLLREGGPQAGLSFKPELHPLHSFHPAHTTVRDFILEQVEGGSGKAFGTLCLLGVLKECLANFPPQCIKVLCELILKQMTLSSSEMKSAGLQALNGLFTSVSGPDGLTPEMNGQLISALYSYKPSLVDARMLEVWVEVMRSAHLRLYRSDPALCFAHLPNFFKCCMECLLANKPSVAMASANTMTGLLRECFSPSSEISPNLVKTRSSTAERLFRCVEGGLKYRFHSVWPHVFDILKSFYLLLGRGQSQQFMTKSLVSLSELRDLPNFTFPAELESAFAVAIETMGPRVVLSAVPLQLDVDDMPYTFPKSWVLPLLREHVRNTKLKYFVEVLMPLADRLSQKADVLREAKRPLEEKLLYTLETQLWDTLPGFCTFPTDLQESFRAVARILGSVLKDRPSKRRTVCRALCNLIETTRGHTEDTALVASFAKNYLPILFNLYTSESAEVEDTRVYLLECIKMYASVSDVPLLETFFSKALSLMQLEDLSVSTMNHVADLALGLLPRLPSRCIEWLYSLTHPLLRSTDSRSQKKGYTMISSLLSLDSPSCLQFMEEHAQDVQKALVDNWENVTPGAKKPRLRCLVSVVDSLKSDPNSFLLTVLPEVLLGLKETNERTRAMSSQLIVKMGFATMKCSDGTSEDSITRFLSSVLAGLAGSPHLVSATIVALTRLVHEFHDLLGSELVNSLLSNVTLLLRAKSREVVKAAMTFVKVIIGVLTTEELIPHLEKMVRNLCNWSGDGRNHFRLKSRYTFEKLIRKVGYDAVYDAAPKEHRKFIVHTHKMAERKKRQRREEYEAYEEEESEGSVPSKKRKQISSFASDSSSDEEENTDPYEAGKKTHRRQTWIQEDDEPVDLLDRTVVKKILSTDPALGQGKRKRPASFITTEDGRLVIEDEEKRTVDQGEPLTEEAMDLDKQSIDSHGTKVESNVTTNEPRYQGGGRGIHRVVSGKKRTGETGERFKAKRAGGDLKKKGGVDPYAYLPLDRQKLNRRKKMKLKGQYSRILKSAKVGSVTGTKKAVRTRKSRRL